MDIVRRIAGFAEVLAAGGRQGIKVLDRVLETSQIDWLVIRREECPDENAERPGRRGPLPCAARAVEHASGLRRPGANRRSRNRVLFCQESGVRP